MERYRWVHNFWKQERLSVSKPHPFFGVYDGIPAELQEQINLPGEGGESGATITTMMTTVSSSQGCRKPVGCELCNNNLSKARSATASRLFIGASAKLLRLVFTSSTLYFCLLYFRYVLGYRIAVVLVNSVVTQLSRLCGPKKNSTLAGSRPDTMAGGCLSLELFLLPPTTGDTTICCKGIICALCWAT